MPHYQAIVVGCGGLGCATLYRLAGRLGPGVLGIEQFRLGHERGASQDHSRIIRLAQHQPQYAALAPAAYQAWREVGKASGPWIGVILADLGCEGTSLHPVEAFSLARPAITGPAFEKEFHT
jgi:hypothetical protein